MGESDDAMAVLSGLVIGFVLSAATCLFLIF